PPFAPLRDAYRIAAVQAAMHESCTRDVLDALRAAGADALVVKGWGLASLYPEPGLRAYEDLDLFLPPEQAAVARGALPRADCGRCPIEIHTAAHTAFDRSPGELFARARRVECGGIPVRTFGAEDHLRFVALHMWSHYAYRPIWLCDVAALLETRPADFDW